MKNYYYPERKHMYRAKREDNEEWVYGDLISYREQGSFIFPRDAWVSFDLQGSASIDLCKIITSTLGLSLQLYDTEGESLYEGDVIEKKDGRYMLFVENNKLKMRNIDTQEIITANIDESKNSMKVLKIGNIFDDRGFQTFTL